MTKKFIKYVLKKFGYALVNIRNKNIYNQDNWFVELWTIKSTWSPSDFELFLMFEHDGSFYSVAISNDMPKNHHETKWKGRLFLKRKFERDLPEFLEILNFLRTEKTKK